MFAHGKSDRNYVWVAAHEDWQYEQTQQLIGIHQSAAHGGLIVTAHKKSGAPDAFHSTLSIGPLQYVFFIKLSWVERVELYLAYHDVYKWCREQVINAVKYPMSESQKKKAGIIE